MEVECVKYKEKMDSDEAECRHAGDYCKYRTSCIIQFMASERKDQPPVKKQEPETTVKGEKE